MHALASVAASTQLQFVHGPSLRKILRRASMSIGCCFILLLLVLVILNSSKRNSVLSSIGNTSRAENYFTGLPQPTADTSQLRLQDFHRVAIKEGRTIWEVRAKDAQYYSAEGITHLNQASLILYQEDDTSISLKADAAKLHMGEEGLSRAELLGHVLVKWDNGMQIETDSALYELVSAKISAPGWVKILGDGYILEGDGFYALIEREQVTFTRNVRTVFNGKSNKTGSSKSSSSGAAALLKKMRPKKDKTK